ncbi:MAG TPA: hypothetical protein VIJ36_01470 [Thermoanaerobaculia bacterium]
MCRTILLTLALFVLAVAAAAAAPAPAAPQGCAPSLDILTPGAQAVCKPAAAATAPAQPEFMSNPKPFRGHCACGCSFTPDCNTSADCGGSACLAGVTCC